MHCENLLRQSGHETREVGLQLVEVRRSAIEEAQQPGGRESTVKDYWYLLCRRKWTIFLFAAALLSVVGIASLVKTPLYDGAGRISVARESSDSLGLKGGGDISGDIPEYSMFLEAQVYILQSIIIVLQVDRDLHWLDVLDQSSVDKKPATPLDSKREAAIIGRIQSRLDVTRVPRTPIIEIRYSDPDPRIAAAVVNALIHAYVSQNFKTKYETAMQVSNWLTGQLQELKTRVESSQPKLVDYQIKSEIKKLAETSRTTYLIALKREQMLRAALEAQKQQANQLNENAIQYNILKHDLQSDQQLYDGLQEKLKEAGVSAGLRASNVAVVDYARVPMHPSKPNIPFNLPVGLLIGCLAGGMFVLVLEQLDDSLRTPGEGQATTALPSIAVIPALAPENGVKAAQRLKLAGSTNGHKGEVELITYSNPKSEFAECYRALTTSLLLSSAIAPPKVVLITSALSYEGKTTTSVNCAIVMAQNGARVLLIDADLGTPKIHKALGLPSRSPGLSTLLSGSAPLNPADVIVRSAQLPTLFVLPAGPVPDQAAELLGSTGMKKLLNQWRDQFDHIVIDTAPVLSATESVVLSVEADSVLLTVRSGVTPKDALLRARDLLLGVGAKVTGVVVNAVDLQEPNLRYYYPYPHHPTEQTERGSGHE